MTTVERLKKIAHNLPQEMGTNGEWYPPDLPAILEALDAIRRVPELEAEVARLKESLAFASHTLMLVGMAVDEPLHWAARVDTVREVLRRKP